MLIIVLTSNRPHLLGRCLAELTRYVVGGDRVLILDDSTGSERRRSMEAVKSLNHERFAYLHAADAFAFLRKRCSPDSLRWMRRSYRRDIAPLRNLSLALFGAHESHSICAMIDDDVIPRAFDQMARVVRTIEDDSYLAGPNMGGIDEMDTITRLFRICARLESSPITNLGRPPQEVLLESAKVASADCGTVLDPCDYVSAGCMFFNRVSAFHLPFPPGYNEDWIWCLMRQTYGTRVYRLPHVVEHAPDSLRPVSERDLFFEVVGDVVLALLMDLRLHFAGLEWFSLPEVHARIAPVLAAIQDTGRALYKQLHVLRQESAIARSAITDHEVSSLFSVCCNGSVSHVLQQVQNRLNAFPNHVISFRHFLNNDGIGPLELLKERIYAD